MIVNKYKILLNNTDKQIDIPIKMDFDFYDQDNDIDIFQEKTELEIIGKPIDFESRRFSHSGYTTGNSTTLLTDINYKFYFFNSATAISAATSANWDSNYLTTGLFSERNLYYFEDPFNKSFFKIDFYDSPNDTNQTIYLTVILPVQQGVKLRYPTVPTISPFIYDVDLSQPIFKLDSIGANKEGFYIYWINNTRFINVTTFYMSAKFFNGRTGKFERMMNRNQASLGGTRFNFNPETHFYNKVVINYNTSVYSVFDPFTGNRIGTVSQPINWYQYVSP